MFAQCFLSNWEDNLVCICNSSLLRIEKEYSYNTEILVLYILQDLHETLLFLSLILEAEVILFPYCRIPDTVFEHRPD